MQAFCAPIRTWKNAAPAGMPTIALDTMRSPSHSTHTLRSGGGGAVGHAVRGLSQTGSGLFGRLAPPAQRLSPASPEELRVGVHPVGEAAGDPGEHEAVAAHAKGVAEH